MELEDFELLVYSDEAMDELGKLLSDKSKSVLLVCYFMVFLHVVIVVHVVNLYNNACIQFVKLYSLLPICISFTVSCTILKLHEIVD
jgi:hypothetical protein